MAGLDTKFDVEAVIEFLITKLGTREEDACHIALDMVEIHDDCFKIVGLAGQLMHNISINDCESAEINLTNYHIRVDHTKDHLSRVVHLLGGLFGDL